MKEFMMIFVGGDYESKEMSPEDFQRRMGKWQEWVDQLKKDDLFIDGRALKNASSRISGVDQLVTDGPFVEIKELVTGYFIIKARDLAHASSLTDGYPDYDLNGQVEIREIETFS